MKTSELTGPALDWAVAKAEGLKTDIPSWADTPWVRCTDPSGVQYVCPEFSTNWSRGGPIIERELICVDAGDGSYAPLRKWAAWCADNAPVKAAAEYHGPTPLIAAMRCYVASKLGDEVDVPKELL